MNQKINTAAKWSAVTEFAAKLITPLVNIILARLLVPEAFGMIATITMVISFAELFTDAGFQKYLIQHEFPDEETLDKSTTVAFWTNLAVSAVLCAAVFLFRHPLARLVGSPELGNSIGAASLLIILAAFSSIQTARFRRAMNFKTLFYVRIGTALIPLVVTVPLAILFRDYRALLSGTFASHLFSAVILTRYSVWKPKFEYSFTLFREMFSFSVWTLLESISIWFTSYIGVFIVGNYLNSYYLGLYKTSMSTVNAYMSIITGAITPVLFSALSRYQNDEENYKDTYYRFQRLTALFVIPMGIGIYIYRDFVTKILLGSQWTEAGDFIGLWGLFSAFTIVFSHFSSEVHRSKGRPKISLLTQVLHLAFLVPTLQISVNGGFETLYIARSLVRVQLILSSLVFMHFMYGLKIQYILRNVFPFTLAAVLMGGAGYLLRQISISLLWQFTSVFLCMILYFLLLFLLFPGIRAEFKRWNLLKYFKKKS